MTVTSTPEIYHVEVGKGVKGSYKRRHTTTNEAQAWVLYGGISIGNGYKKRIVLVTPERRIVIMQQAST